MKRTAIVLLAATAGLALLAAAPQAGAQEIRAELEAKEIMVTEHEGRQGLAEAEALLDEGKFEEARALFARIAADAAVGGARIDIAYGELDDAESACAALELCMDMVEGWIGTALSGLGTVEEAGIMGTFTGDSTLGTLSAGLFKLDGGGFMGSASLWTALAPTLRSSVAALVPPRTPEGTKNGSCTASLALAVRARPPSFVD